MITTKSHVRFDWAAKKILRSKANFGILEGFLSELFGEDIKIKSLLSEEGNKESLEEKSNRVDILIENAKGEIVIVEIQNTRELDYLFRVLFGASKAITEYMKEGSPYRMVKKVITISIVYFNFGQGKDYLYKGQTTFEGVNQHDIFELSDEQKRLFKKETVSDIFPFHYLIRVNQFDDVAKNTIDEWIYFFKNSEIKDEFKAKGLKEAREKLKTLSMSPKQLSEYRRYLEALSANASIAETMTWELEWEKQEAEKAKQEAEKAKQEAEKANQEAEKAKQEAEKANQEAEKANQEAEKANQEAEKAKQEAEKANQEAEKANQEAEKVNKALEKERIEHEIELKQKEFDQENALKQKQLEIANKLIKNGLTNEIIINATELSDSEIEKLRNKLNDYL